MATAFDKQWNTLALAYQAYELHEDVCLGATAGVLDLTTNQDICHDKSSYTYHADNSCSKFPCLYDGCIVVQIWDLRFILCQWLKPQESVSAASEDQSAVSGVYVARTPGTDNSVCTLCRMYCCCCQACQGLATERLNTCAYRLAQGDLQ